MAFYLDEETPAPLLHRAKVEVAAGAAGGVTFRWPTAGHAGKHRIAVAARSGDDTRRIERPLEILAAQVRSTRRLGGAWVDIYHHSEAEGKYFNEGLAKMAGPQWRELVRAMHVVQMDILVITMMFQNFTHRGQHNIPVDGYQGKAYYPSNLFPSRMPIASQDPLEAILSEADRRGLHVMPGVGCNAFFDYTPDSLKVRRLPWRRRQGRWTLQGSAQPTKFADLTTLSQRNNGMFAFLWVQEVIDGRQTFRAHGPREMPIWGLDYLAMARESYMDVPYDAEAYVRTRILALTEYIYRLQAK